MRKYGTKKILPVYGNSRPVERRINNIRIAGWEEQTFNATSVSQNDTYNDSAFLKINGKSEQIQTIQGKNLFDKNKVKLNYYVDVNGVEQASASWRIGTIYINPSINIVISGITNQGSAPYYCFFDINNNLLLATKGTLVSSGSYLITTPPNTVYGKFSINATDINNAMVEIGSTATAYTPFVPNSPSPDYPSTINSVSNFDLVSSGKNLINVFGYKSKSSVLSIDENGTVTNTQTTTSSNMDIVYDVYIPAGKTVLSANITGRFFIGGLIANGGTSNTWVQAATNKYVINFAKGKIVEIRIRLLAGTGEASASNIQLERGEVLTSYEQYKGNTINFPYTLRSLPNGTKDYIEIDNVNKTAKLYRNIGEKTLNGTENFSSSLINNRYVLYGITDMYANTSINYIVATMSEVFNSVSWVNRANYGETDAYVYLYTAPSPNDRAIVIGNPNTPTLEAFKQWLTDQYNAGTPFTIYYPLATPPAPEILNYKEVITYYPYTQIYTNATIQPNLDGTVRIIER